MAIHLAAANPGKVAALMVENTFTSIEDVAPKVRPFIHALQQIKRFCAADPPLKFHPHFKMHSCAGRMHVWELALRDCSIQRFPA